MRTYTGEEFEKFNYMCSQILVSYGIYENTDLYMALSTKEMTNMKYNRKRRVEI